METSLLLRLAAERQPFTARVGVSTRSTAPPVGLGTFLSLWNQPGHPDRPNTGGWCFLAFDGKHWSAPIVEPELVTYLDLSPIRTQAPADLVAGVSGLEPATLVEACALAGRTETRCRFRYRKVDGTDAGIREHVLVGCKGDMVFGKTDKDELRGFKFSGISHLQAVHAARVPRWDGSAYTRVEVEGG